MKKKIMIIYLIQILLISGIYFIFNFLLFGYNFKISILQSVLFAIFYFVGLPYAYKLVLYLKKSKPYQLGDGEEIFVDEEVRMLNISFIQKVNLKITGQNLIWTYYNQSKVYDLQNLNDIKVKEQSIIFYFQHQKVNFITEKAQDILDVLETERQNSNLNCT